MMTNSINKNKFYASFYGLAIGDALGVPVEFMTREELQEDPVTDMREYGTYSQPKGTWSDDTSMSLATLSVLSEKYFSYSKICDEFTNWYQNAKFTPHGETFDIGNTTVQAIYHYLLGAKPLECGLSEETSNGNGSLMRMLPVLHFIYLEHWEDDNHITPFAREFIYNLSALTHAHELSKMACLYYVYIGGYILKYTDTMTLPQIIEKAIQNIDQYYHQNYEDITIYNYMQSENLLTSLSLTKNQLKSTGFVIHSLEASIWCLYNTKNYKEAVLTAVNLGEDTDTIGAITGSLAGLYYGLDSIPKEWIDDLQNKALIDEICDQFYAKYKPKKTAIIT
ncbi:ADP-ribosylglycohydrolase family protein [Pasteurella atlantica]|uniref:ADP-ribosylglycohydrolase family protein n=2 Tax=Pasteurellales TaxID=135625 RepID=UPI0027755579|nr:ADP-ribosylglycohydrolase family protein [Pasteurella atlantica]MDP8125146.1 ADP-ribosylglycohydrolase family protein [Pasteurella atlantica]MDP8150957.1 ADP-ribosylglycohydrolase family protein [Pasteurella atlantica]